MQQNLNKGDGADEETGFCLRVYRKTSWRGSIFRRRTKGGFTGTDALDQTLCGTGKGARSVGVRQEPQVLPQAGGGAHRKISRGAVNFFRRAFKAFFQKISGFLKGVINYYNKGGRGGL